MIKLLVLLLLPICLLNANENSIELGIGNFPIPDLEQQFIYPGDTQFSSGHEMQLNKPLEKHWQLSFDIKVLESTATVITLSNKLMVFVFASKIGMSPINKPNDISWKCNTKMRQWLKVEIVYNFDDDDNLKIIVDENQCECEKKKKLKFLIDSITDIKFGDAANNNAIRVKNMILTNGLIEYLIDEVSNVRQLDRIHTIKLFKTFRMIFELKITEQCEEMCTIFSIRKRTTGQMLMEISYKENFIYYCHFFIEHTKTCKTFEFVTTKWIYSLIDQWMENSQYLNIFLVNSNIDNFALKKEENRYSIITPQIYDVFFESNPNSTVEIKKFRIFNPASNEFGIVRYNGKPFCSIGWSKENSKVVCNMLKKNSIAMTVNASLFTEIKYFDFSNNIVCKGNEELLHSCSFSKDKESCFENGQYKPPAAVHCGLYTPYSVENGRINIEHSGLPRCYRNDAEAGKVCTKLFQDLFDVTSLHGKVVESSRKKLAAYSVLYKNQGCVKKMDSHQCEYDVIHDCKHQQIQCSTCFKKELNDIINKLKFKGSNSNVIKSLKDASDKLQTCGRWFKMNCNSNYKLDPNLCSLHSVIIEAIRILKESIKSTTSITLPAKCDVQEYLKYDFLKTSFDDLLSNVRSSRESIGKYFNELASFDGEIAKHDIAYALDEWRKAEQIISEKLNGLHYSFIGLSGLGNGVQLNNLIQETAKLAVQIAGSFNPIKWLANTDGSINGIMESTTNIANLGADLGIGFKNQAFIPILIEILRKATSNMENNKNVFTSISNIFKKVTSENAITPEDSAIFLELYRDFTPAINNEFIVSASVYIDILMYTFSQNIRDSSSIVGAALQVQGDDLINNVTMSTKVLMGQFEVVAEKQFEIMEAFARSAKAMIAKKSAQNIINVKNKVSDLDPDFQKQLLDIKGIYLLREQKIRIYTHVCNIYTYRNHGVQPQVCKEILDNPDKSVLKLISYDSRSDMCSNAEKIKKLVLIPLSLQGDLEQGILSSNDLYNYRIDGTSGSTYFKIPNKNWMVKHGWISKDQDGPLFLKKFQLYIPPEAIDVSFSYKIIMKLSKVTLHNKNYFLQSTVSNYFSYHNEDCIASINNPYKMNGCRDHIKDICILTHGNVIGEFLPVVENSIWSIQLQSQTNLTKLYPANEMYLKAEIELCWKSNTLDDLEYKRQISTDKTNSCCNNNDFYDLLQEIAESRRKSDSRSFCKKCDDGTNAAFFGYFCQKCPSKYEKSNEWFGCKVINKTKKK
ncbi:uncharacterized protein LOC105846200 isoform X2 [Hydra vulgaris]|uniref:Uncharacterized protein LOC105846200 isoform X2 n=1 Tax=Hydra vulgaris TaxID=6087 RepID=A0ABM4CPG7_HYDVU